MPLATLQGRPQAGHGDIFPMQSSINIPSRRGRPRYLQQRMKVATALSRRGQEAVESLRILHPHDEGHVKPLQSHTSKHVPDSVCQQVVNGVCVSVSLL